MNAAVMTDPTPCAPDAQQALADGLAADLASVLRRMAVLDGKGERATASALAGLPDARILGDRLASIGFAYGEGVDHAFASWQLRSEPDEEDPDGEIQTDAALAMLLLNEIVFTNEHHWRKEWPEDARRTTSMHVDCSDVFAWGCADGEDMTRRDVAEVFRYWEKDRRWGPAVWCMIRRRERPQRPVAKRITEAGVWDLDALTAEHGLRPNHYDGISAIRALQQHHEYSAWARSEGRTPIPFGPGWWDGWREFVAANPSWYDASWKAREAEDRDAWRRDNGYAP